MDGLSAKCQVLLMKSFFIERKDNFMKCIDNCGYYWKEENEEYPSCHFEGPIGWAPCEQEEYYEEERTDEK